MKIGYARVSTTDQNPAVQLTALKRERCRHILTDTASGASRKRPELDKCLKSLKAGDVLIVWKLDRLGRSLRDLITLLDELKGQGVKFKSLTEAIDTETPTGRAMWQMVGVLAELERSLIQERTKAEGREGSGKAARRQAGPQAETLPTTGRPRAEAYRKRRKPAARGATAQGGTLNIVCGARNSNTVRG